MRIRFPRRTLRTCRRIDWERRHLGVRWVRLPSAPHGAADAVEAAICWLKLRAGDVVGVALSNSFAFGGSNASVALVREDA